MTDLAAQLAGRRLLIFDFDGTVADTSPLHAQGFAQVLSPYGVRVDYPRIAGVKTADAMRHLLAGAGQKLNEAEIMALVEAKQRIVRAMIAADLEPLPGIEPLLRWAAPRFRLCLVTSGSRATITLALGRLGYTDLFDPLICAEDLARGKPDPEGYLAALEQTGVRAKEAIVFEDSEAGFAAARAAGLDYIDARQNLWVALQGTGQ